MSNDVSKSYQQAFETNKNRKNNPNRKSLEIQEARKFYN
jgi:hypothetical protein